MPSAPAAPTDPKTKAEPSFRRSGPFRGRIMLFSPLTRRILAVNILALALLVAGLLFLGQYKQSLIEAEIEALRVQAEMLASALGETAVTLGPTQTERLRVRRAQILLRRLVEPMRSRARLFNLDGELIGDTSMVPGLGALVSVEELPAQDDSWLTRTIKSAYDFVAGLSLFPDSLPVYVETPYQTAADYGEVVSALEGFSASAVRTGPRGGMVLSVAVPVQRYKQVVGAVMVSMSGRGVEESLREVRIGILQVFFVSFTVTVLLSLYLASTIVRPVRHLAAAAKRVRYGFGRHRAIPDYSARNDEIGDLSRDMGAMNEALWNRLDAIEQFAADVAHEIKNPLTSLRSAVETVARIDDPKRRAQLLDILVADVARLDRLMSDIADASRLDAELSRTQFERVDLIDMLAGMASHHNERAAPGAPKVETAFPSERATVLGMPGRLVQVFRNLIENAASFSPRGGTIRLAVAIAGDEVVVTVDDDGPGIPEGMEEKIFDRFYSERPKGETYGTHSGLGLSISRQIVATHNGAIRAHTRRDSAGNPLGARFAVSLPIDPSGG